MRLIFIAPIVLAGCMAEGDGLGRAGSPEWFATTSNDQIIAYYRQDCMAYGYTGDQLPVCIQQEISTGRQCSRSQMRNIIRP